MRRFLASLLGLLFVAPGIPALAQREPYPSLLPRPVENRDRDVEAVAGATAAPASVDPALATEIAGLAEMARLAGADYERLAGDVDGKVAAASAVGIGGEAWVTAQQAISALQKARYGSVAALATLDTLYVRHAADENVAQAAANVAAIAAARAPVATMVDNQNDRLDALTLRLAMR